MKKSILSVLCVAVLAVPLAMGGEIDPITMLPGAGMSLLTPYWTAQNNQTYVATKAFWDPGATYDWALGRWVPTVGAVGSYHTQGAGDLAFEPPVPFYSSATAPQSAAGTVIGGGFAPFVQSWFNTTGSTTGNSNYAAEASLNVPFYLSGASGLTVPVLLGGLVELYNPGIAGAQHAQAGISGPYGYQAIEVGRSSWSLGGITGQYGPIGVNSIEFLQTYQLQTNTIYSLFIRSSISSAGDGFAYAMVDPTVVVDPTFQILHPEVRLNARLGFLTPSTQSVPDYGQTALLVAAGSLLIFALRQGKISVSAANAKGNAA